MLTDFSLARAARLTALVRDRLVATARYVSPEQAGLLDFEVDERLDLYSVGTVLFECLAGRPLFPGDGFGEVLRQHLTMQPPMLRDLGVGAAAPWTRRSSASCVRTPATATRRPRRRWPTSTRSPRHWAGASWSRRS